MSEIGFAQYLDNLREAPWDARGPEIYPICSTFFVKIWPWYVFKIFLAKESTLNAGKLLLGGLLRSSVINHPYMTPAIYHDNSIFCR